MKKREQIKVIHKAPKKKGKEEYRFFKTIEEVAEYFNRNNEARLKNK